MFGDEIAHLGQLSEHLDEPDRFGMGHHVPATASAIGGRVMRDQGQAGIKRITAAAMSLVTGLRPLLFAGRRTLAGWRRCTGAVAGRRLGELPPKLIEAVLQLGDAVEELYKSARWPAPEWWHSRGMHGVLLMGSVSKEQDQSKAGKVGSRDDRLIFPVSIIVPGEYPSKSSAVATRYRATNLWLQAQGLPVEQKWRGLLIEFYAPSHL